MNDVIKTAVRDFLYVLTNYIIAYIPFWWVRKALYLLLGMKIGKGSRICMRCIIFSPWRISIGKNTMINEYVLLDGRGGLKIGDNCSLSMWAIVYTASHASKSPDFQYYSRATEIGNCCWIGARAVILPGSSLKDRSVVSANSVLKGVAEENGVYIGNPAEKKRSREIDANYQQRNLNFFK